MNIRIMKIKKKIKSRLTDLWYFTMKPLAFVIGKSSDKQYEKLADRGMLI